MSQHYDDLDRLELLTIVKGYLVNKTPLRVGAGRESPLGSAADLTPLKIDLNGKTVPYIPGSSLKGVLRSLTESLARAQGLRVHDPWDLNEVENEWKNKSYCVICGIFGSTKLASHVRIYDAYPVKVDEPRTFLKRGVVIDRDFRGARPGLLYTEEQVEPGVRWGFRMDIVNIKVFPEPEDDRGKLLRQIFRMLTGEMIQIGARRTLGYGLISLVNGKYEEYKIQNGTLEKIMEGDVA